MEAFVFLKQSFSFPEAPGPIAALLLVVELMGALRYPGFQGAFGLTSCPFSIVLLIGATVLMGSRGFLAVPSSPQIVTLCCKSGRQKSLEALAVRGFIVCGKKQWGREGARFPRPPESVLIYPSSQIASKPQ